MKLIDKSAVVTEIKSYISNYKEIVAKTNRNDSTWVDSVSIIDAKIDVLQHVLFFLDTLKVKEVDLENESELIANEIMIEVQANKYHTNIYNTERNDFNHSHLWHAARKGIELGLKAKGE